MGTQVFDDGSTLTTGPDGSITSTPAWDWSPSSYSSAFTLPSGSGNQLADLAKLALGAYTANRQAAMVQNAVPTQARAPSAAGAGSPQQMMGGLLPLVVVGLLVFLVARQ